MALSDTPTSTSQSSTTPSEEESLSMSPQLQWFVMRVTYSRELKAQAQLQEIGVETYIPLIKQRTEKGCQPIAVIHNLIFVHTTRNFLDFYKQHKKDCPLRYTMDKSTGLPMVVRDKEMKDFMRVMYKASSKDILYLDNPDIVATKGTPITIIDGPYKGIEGYLLRIRRDRKVVLQLEGIVACALNGIPITYCKIRNQ